MDYLKNTHDLRLPDWGPYSKRFFGLSHLANTEKGFRFDLALMPGLYRRDIFIPEALKEASYTPWEAATDLSYYSYRQQIEWKDKIYCDISFSTMAENVKLMRCECVNNMEKRNSLALHMISGLTLSDRPQYKPVLPEGAIWLDAVNYSELAFSVPRAQDNLVVDGLRRGEGLTVNTTGFSCIGQGFGGNAGDSIQFDLPKLDFTYSVILRYQLPKNTKQELQLAGLATSCVELIGNGQFEAIKIAENISTAGKLVITTMKDNSILLDCLVLCPDQQTMDVDFIPADHDNTPHIQKGPIPNSIIIKYQDSDHYYGLWWNSDRTLVRKYQVANLKETLLYDDAVHQHFLDNFDRDGDDRHVDVLMQPITIEANSSETVYALVCNGTQKEVTHILEQTDKSSDLLEKHYSLSKQNAVLTDCLPEGKKYALSQQLMSAVVMTNIVYPIYTKQSFIRHSTPGRCWNSLYTWDSGFIGLGLLEMDMERAIDNLNAYVTEVGDSETAFIHHGSPVPVQHYLFLEMWNRSQDTDMLRFFYPRLKQYYDFLAGHTGSSTTRSFNSHLLKTWDYFYNSAGWDDYPPQLEIHKKHLHSISAIAPTAHTIRAAKILKMAALELGFAKDAEFFQADIETFSNALQSCAWDEKSGYFSYVVHDETGNPIEHYTHESGANYNMGLDGMTPLLSGACLEKQADEMFAKLASNRFNTKVGLSTVDQTAPYYRNDGYWNGSVWMPYQWFFWKSCLNEGKGELAWKIAKKALDIWQQETEESYYCFEHFIIESGRGAGWHHFSGLSTPVLCWFNAYFKPGTITTGYDVWMHDKQVDLETKTLKANLKIEQSSLAATSILIVMGSGNYAVKYNKQTVPYTERIPGTLEIELPQNSEGILEISCA